MATMLQLFMLEEAGQPQVLLATGIGEGGPEQGTHV
jgi:hypothetical protein